MSKWQEILAIEHFPHIQRGGVTLVAREDASACVRLIADGGYRFLGWDAFTLSADSIQPHLEWSEDWSNYPQVQLHETLARLASHPANVTHYEFVFWRET